MSELTATTASRRDLLKRVAVAGGAVVVAPMLTSTSALADSGTVKCRYTGFSGGTVALTYTRGGFGNGNLIGTLNFVAPTGGTCPCSPTTNPTIRYAYWIQVRRYTVASGGSAAQTWTGSVINWSVTGNTSVSTSDIGVGFGNNYYEVDLQVGWRAECPGIGVTPAMLCRFGTFARARGGSFSAGDAVWTLAASAVSSATPPGNLVSC